MANELKLTHLKSGILDNRSRGFAYEFLTSRAVPNSRLRIVSAFFTSAAYGHLREVLDRAGPTAFLFGEPRFLSNFDGPNLGAPEFSLTESGLSMREQLRQRGTARACSAWIRDRVEIRSARQQHLLHGKMLHIDDGRRAHALVGSSNFTVAGLGLSQNSNIELNLVVDSDRDREDLREWFDEIWGNDSLTIDVKDEVLRRLDQLYAHASPQFVYQKTLFEMFGDFISEQIKEDQINTPSDFCESAIWNMLYSFQQDGARAVIGKLEQHGGCILADSVGLGKTLTSLAVIKWYQLRGKTRVLVLCPKKLEENWREYLSVRDSDANPLLGDDFRYTVLSHTDLNRESGHVGLVKLEDVKWSQFDLVVVDESHAFRNPGGERYKKLLNEVICSGRSTKVLLLSATPVNNDIADLKAQIDLIGRGRNDAFQHLGVRSLSTLLGDARRRFGEWMRDDNRDARTLVSRLPLGLTTLLDGLSIARSRRHIERHYVDTADLIGRFPKRGRPQTIRPGIDLHGNFPSFDRIDMEIEQLSLALYHPMEDVLPEHRAGYAAGGDRPIGFDQENREKYLIKMMKVGLLKRLESSVASFAQTMDRMVQRIDQRLTEIAAFRKAGGPSEFQGVLPDEVVAEDEEVAAAFEVGKRLKYDLRHMNVDAWERKLLADRERIANLAGAAREIGPERDAKLAVLSRIVREKLTNPTRNADGSLNRKLILFTAFTDTAEYLYNQLAPLARELEAHAALVTGSRCRATLGRSQFQHVLTNFAPRSKKRPVREGLPTDEIDLLIATDCISEGQNLQDADLVVNVDIHWNPVRLIQRFGRIDRIGSLADTAQMINFWPTDDLNVYLRLRDRVEARMALVDLSATGEDNLLAETREEAEADLNWRDEQLRRLQTEVFDLDEAGEGVSLAEFTLDGFRADLLAFARANEKALEDAPLGLNAIVPTELPNGRLEPGAIFCLRRPGDEGRRDVNPLDPYFLVYVRDDGSVRHGFSQPKTILGALQQLCSGRTEPIAELCDAFDEETAQGADLDRYDALAASAVADLAAAYAASAASGLRMGMGGKLPDKGLQARVDTGYELITWFVLRNR